MIIRKRLIAIILKTFALSIPLTMLGLRMLLDPHDLEAPDLQGLAYGLALFMILALSMSSATMFLNLLPRIRNSAGYSFLSFFLMPFISAVILINYMGNFMSDLAIYGTMVMPFFMILAFYYLKFWRQRAQYIENRT